MDHIHLLDKYNSAITIESPYWTVFYHTFQGYIPCEFAQKKLDTYIDDICLATMPNTYT